MSSEFDLKMLEKAVNMSKLCPLTDKAYCVGAIIIDKDKNIISTGYSRETAKDVHAEEVAISKAIKKGINLKGTTIYSSMEPCGQRLSGKKCCADRIIEAGITRLVYGIDEPPFFVSDAKGIEKLKSKGVEVIQIGDVISEIEKINKHILDYS